MLMEICLITFMIRDCGNWNMRTFQIFHEEAKLHGEYLITLYTLNIENEVLK